MTGIEQIWSTCLNKNLPFFSFRKPGQPLFTGIGNKPAEILKDLPEDPLSCPGFIVSPFDTAKGFFLIRTHISFAGDSVSPATVSKIDSLQGLPAASTEDTIPNEVCSQERFVQKVKKAIKQIEDKKLDKVVLSHPYRINGNHISKVPHIVHSTLKAYPHAFVSVLNLPGHGIWIGATPELLLSRHGNELATTALAGTRQVSPAGTPWDAKNIEEQKIVEQYITGICRQFCTTVEALPTATARAGHIEHLLTKINMKLPAGTPAAPLLRALHPTPAVCGSPKEESRSFILAEEGYDRCFFSGFLGHISSATDFDLYVNLRCMRVTPHATTLYAGCGITAHSNPQKEWEETETKIDTLLTLIDS